MNEDDWTLYSSYGIRKVSHHLVSLNHYVSNSKEAEAFAVGLALESGPLDTFLDRSVYKSIQCFRILNSSKPGCELRFKQVVRHPWSEMEESFGGCQHSSNLPIQALGDSLITNVRGLILLTCSEESKSFRNQRTRKGPVARSSNLGDKTSLASCVKKLMDLHHRFLSGWNFSSVFSINVCEESSCVRLNRKIPSVCLIHHRIHDSDNSYITLQGACIGRRDIDGDLISPAVTNVIHLSLRCFRGSFKECVYLGALFLNADDRWSCCIDTSSEPTPDTNYSGGSTSEDVKCLVTSMNVDIPRGTDTPRGSETQPRKRTRMQQGIAKWQRRAIPKIQIDVLDFM